MEINFEIKDCFTHGPFILGINSEGSKMYAYDCDKQKDISWDTNNDEFKFTF